MSTNLGATINGYLEYCATIKKLTHGTVKDVKCSINRLIIYCAESGVNKECWALSLPEYIQWVNACRDNGLTAKHINKNLSHVRGLIDYVWNLEKLDRNVLDGYYIKDSDQRKDVEIPTIAEAKKLVGAFTVKCREERQNRLIVLLLYGCGLRNGELCGLNIQDIDHERREIKVTGKGKQRVIPLMDVIYTELLAYLNDRRSSTGALFKTFFKKTRVRISDVIEIVDEATRRVGIEKRITPKTLRHTFASHLAERGVDVGVIAKLMGHRSPWETSVYLHAPKQKLNETVFKSTNTKKEET